MYVKFFLLGRIATGVLLVICFLLNSWVIFTHYIRGKMVTSSEVTINPKGKQLMPNMLICRETAYDTVREMAKLEDYLDNTMKLEYKIDDEDGSPVEWNSTKLKRASVYSMKRGHCYVLKYTKKVRANVVIHLLQFFKYTVTYN